MKFLQISIDEIQLDTSVREYFTESAQVDGVLKGWQIVAELDHQLKFP